MHVPCLLDLKTPVRLAIPLSIPPVVVRGVIELPTAFIMAQHRSETHTQHEHVHNEEEMEPLEK